MLVGAATSVNINYFSAGLKNTQLKKAWTASAFRWPFKCIIQPD